MNTKPFNLADALAGKPVVTRGGRKVIKIIDTVSCADFPIVAVVSQNGTETTSTHTRDGSFYSSAGSVEDLLMASTTVTKWINLYGKGIGSAFFYDSEEAANIGKGSFRVGDKAHKITWEE